METSPAEVTAAITINRLNLATQLGATARADLTSVVWRASRRQAVQINRSNIETVRVIKSQIVIIEPISRRLTHPRDLADVRVSTQRPPLPHTAVQGTHAIPRKKDAGLVVNFSQLNSQPQKSPEHIFRQLLQRLLADARQLTSKMPRQGPKPNEILLEFVTHVPGDDHDSRDLIGLHGLNLTFVMSSPGMLTSIVAAVLALFDMTVLI